MKAKKTIIKLITFGSLLFLITLFVKKIAPKSNNYFATIANDILSVRDTSYYFLGSSRVQRMINPQILQEHFNNKNIYNTGISSSTFLSNCILADYLIRNQTPKVLFIELSPITPELPNGLIKFSNEVNLDIIKSINSLNKHQNIRQKILLNLNSLNSYFFFKTSLKEYIKNILDQNSKESKIRLMGYISLNENNFYSTSPFITYKEINRSSRKNKNISSYQQYINHLLKLGNQYNSKIIFFLPVTYKKEKEKDIVIPLYNSLPDSIKIEYSKDFFESITHSKYLLNSNHFNSLGSEQYTKLLCPLIERYFNTK